MKHDINSVYFSKKWNHSCLFCNFLNDKDFNTGICKKWTNDCVWGDYQYKHYDKLKDKFNKYGLIDKVEELDNIIAIELEYKLKNK